MRIVLARALEIVTWKMLDVQICAEQSNISEILQVYIQLFKEKSEHLKDKFKLLHPSAKKSIMLILYRLL